MIGTDERKHPAMKRALHNLRLTFTRRPIAKVSALIFALLLSGYVQYSKNITRSLNIPVQRPDIPYNLTVRSRIPTFLSVKLSGPRDLMEFTGSNFRIVLSNPSPEIGENTFKTKISPAPPEGIEVSFQSDISIYLDALMERWLPVVPRIDNKLDAGVIPAVVTVKPQAIKVKGPRSIVGAMDRFDTEKIELSGRSPLFPRKVLLGDTPEFVSIAPGESIEVEVNMNFINNIDSPSDGDEFKIVEQLIPLQCYRDIPGVKLKSTKNEIRIEVKVERGSPMPVQGEFDARVMCPVYTDEAGEIKPSAEMMSLPVTVTDKFPVSGRTLYRVDPLTSNLQFERIKLDRRVQSIQQGIEEHLIPK